MVGVNTYSYIDNIYGDLMIGFATPISSWFTAGLVRWMGGWVDGWMGGWVDEWMGG